MTDYLLAGRYLLTERIAVGAMDEVWRGHDELLSRAVAVKLLPTGRADQPSFLARFRAEARYVASLSHPGIARVYDYGESAEFGGAYLVMELVDGEPLSAILDRAGRLSPDATLDIINQAARALEVAHKAGIVHRDIKPGNIMVTRNSEIKVMNIARAMSAAQVAMTQTAQVVGTAEYLSPEQVRGERVDSRSDIYSMGCVLYELLTGRPPFTGDSPVAIADQHVRENPVPPSRVGPDMPPWADAIVLQAIAKSSADRYQTAGHMSADLQRAAAGMHVAASYPRLQPTRRRPATVSEVSPVVLKRPTIIRVSEASVRRVENIGDEVRLFNNSRSSSTAVEKITISHVARVSASVDVSKTRTLSTNAGVKFIDIVSAQASLGNELLRHYSLQMGSELKCEQTTEISIPAYTNVEVTFRWVRIWVTGMLALSEVAKRAVEVAEVPFEITIALNFDKETRDID